MEENCAASASNAWAKVKIDDAYEIIKLIIAPKSFRAEGMGELNGMIVSR